MRFVYVLLLILGTQASGQQDSDIQFIVNANNPTTSISAAEIRTYYYRRKRRWPNGAIVRFIESAAQSPTRKVFATKYLDSTPNEADLYWIGQKLYSGDSAPMQESNDRRIIQFVASFDGAIGYLPATVPVLNKKIKAIRVTP